MHRIALLVFLVHWQIRSSGQIEKGLELQEACLEARLEMSQVVLWEKSVDM